MNNTRTNTYKRNNKKYGDDVNLVYKVYLYNDTDRERTYYSYFFETYEDAKEFGFEVKDAANDVSKRRWSFYVYQVPEEEA